MIRVATAGSALVWICLTAHVSSQGPVFVPAPASPVTVGKGSGDVVLADVNRDGHLDLVTQHLLNQNVSVLLGNGAGTFTPVAGGPMRLGYQPATLAVGDVNDDGLLDFAVAFRENEREKVDVFLGRGTGAFSLAPGSSHDLAAATRFYKPSLRFVDVNGDRKLDIITANERRHTIEILHGDGRGGFSRPQVVSMEPGSDYYSSAVADVDGDRHPDIVIAISPSEGRQEQGRLVTRRGDGTGAFNAPTGTPLSVRADPRVAALADVNGDARPDIVLSHRDSSVLSVLVNEAKGTFVPARSPVDVQVPAFSVVVADVNRDKAPDLLATTVNSRVEPFESRIAVLLGGDHRFAPAAGSPFRAGLGAYSLATGDVNGDGKLDLAASSFDSDRVTLLLGQ